MCESINWEFGWRRRVNRVLGWRIKTQRQGMVSDTKRDGRHIHFRSLQWAERTQPPAATHDARLRQLTSWVCSHACVCVCVRACVCAIKDSAPEPFSSGRWCHSLHREARRPLSADFTLGSLLAAAGWHHPPCAIFSQCTIIGNYVAILRLSIDATGNTSTMGDFIIFPWD